MAEKGGSSFGLTPLPMKGGIEYCKTSGSQKKKGGANKKAALGERKEMCQKGAVKHPEKQETEKRGVRRENCQWWKKWGKGQTVYGKIENKN